MDGRLGGLADDGTSAPVINRATIERRLITHVALAANEDPGEIDIRQPFSAYALDSAAAADMTAQLEDWLGVSLSPTLIWDYPSIEQLARHLAQLEEG